MTLHSAQIPLAWEHKLVNTQAHYTYIMEVYIIYIYIYIHTWVFSRDSALRLVDDAKRFFFDTKVFGGLDIDMIYFSLRAACFQ